MNGSIQFLRLPSKNSWHTKQHLFFGFDIWYLPTAAPLPQTRPITPAALTPSL
jgi:hypothetical protein